MKNIFPIIGKPAVTVIKSEQEFKDKPMENVNNNARKITRASFTFTQSICGVPYIRHFINIV